MLALWNDNGVTEEGKKIILIFTICLVYTCGIIGHGLFVILFSKNSDRDNKKISKILLWITSILFIPGLIIMTLIVLIFLDRSYKCLLAWFPVKNNPFIIEVNNYKSKNININKKQ
ncbi:hypothetical protein SGLAD_v1c03360 [Spiroplasma gladiatoris]|uniref:Uncharacterized protein n=1 Tax=Spiroplasma gladiatoris TaxID=2143 RepID=A0A4P7AGL2_9MOLU|nr:hypothetical protein [Spiroplasma gladiatoris]QBQ07535.1 hypothetical protein SGLAD_v1c03360 [Spiroplasma gladiatoris]